MQIPLGQYRHADTFGISALPKGVDDYVWRSLKAFARSRADVLVVEGDDSFRDPWEYRPLVRFFRGPVATRSMVGARLFHDFHSDFRSILIEYLDPIGFGRCKSVLTATGLAVRIEPRPPVQHFVGWREDVEILMVDLVARVPSGELKLAPWRETDRVAMAEALTSRDWRSFYSPHLPTRPVAWEYPPETTMTPDQGMSQADLAACTQMCDSMPAIL